MDVVAVVRVVVFDIIVVLLIARWSLWSHSINSYNKYGVEKHDRKTYKPKDTLREQIVHLRQEYRTLDYPENRVCESSCYEQPLSRWNCTCTLCAVHLFGGVELRNYERQLLMDIVAQRRCIAAFTQTLPSTTPPRTA